MAFWCCFQWFLSEQPAQRETTPFAVCTSNYCTPARCITLLTLTLIFKPAVCFLLLAKSTAHIKNHKCRYCEFYQTHLDCNGQPSNVVSAKSLSKYCTHPKSKLHHNFCRNHLDSNGQPPDVVCKATIKVPHTSGLTNVSSTRLTLTAMDSRRMLSANPLSTCVCKSTGKWCAWALLE